MHLDTRILTRKDEKVVQFLPHWLKARPEFATLEVEEFLRRKFPPFDPRGRGSSAVGGIVMAYVGVNGGGDGVKEKGWSLKLDLWINWELERLRMKKEWVGPVSWAVGVLFWAAENYDIISSIVSL